MLDAAAELSISVALRAPTEKMSANANANANANAATDTDADTVGSVAGRGWETQLWTDRFQPVAKVPDNGKVVNDGMLFL